MTSEEEQINTEPKVENPSSDLSSIINDIIKSPIHLFLIFLCLFLIYKIYKLHSNRPTHVPTPPARKKMKKQNLTLEQLREFDGVKNESILIAINGKIFDVTEKANLYGPEGPYGVLAGRDASRALATFALDQVKDDYDDISDLSPSEMEQMNEWYLQFTCKYDQVGMLIRPGEAAEVQESEDDDGSGDALKNKVD